MPTAIAHAPPFTVPGSSTSTALVRWNGTGGNQIQDSTILVGATTMGLAADTDLVTFSSGTLTIAGTVAATTLTGAGAGITALAAANITASGTLPALNGAALTALNGTQVTTGTLPAARIAADSIVEAKLDVSNGPTNGLFLQAQSGEGGGLTWAAGGGDFSNGGDAGALVLGTNDSNSLTLETNNTARMVLAAAGDVTVSTGNVVIGTAGKGIDFSNQAGATGTMASELLDHYEEGSFTLGLADSSGDGSGESQTYSNQQGQYVKIGRQVFITGYLRTTSLGTLTTSSGASLVGLPFTVAATSGGAAAYFGEVIGFAITAGYTLVGSLPAGATRIDLHLTDTTSGITSLLISEWNTNGSCFFSAHYRV